MKKLIVFLLSVNSTCASAQFQQNINEFAGTISNLTEEVDSIRFNAVTNEMEVLLMNGNVNVYSISDVMNVTFSGWEDITAATCGACGVHNPDLIYNTMFDQDGNLYKTIVIGSQEWMAENLRASHYRNGDEIPYVNDTTQWTMLSTGAYCFYDNWPGHECPFGNLYNWYAVADERNLCPTGWHVPSNDEWINLINYLDPTADGGWAGVPSSPENVAGRKMKNTNPELWEVGVNPTFCTNESGFSALAGGVRAIWFMIPDAPIPSYETSVFAAIGHFGQWWSSSSFNTSSAYYLYLSWSSSAWRQTEDKRDGYSVRCIRD